MGSLRLIRRQVQSKRSDCASFIPCYKPDHGQLNPLVCSHLRCSHLPAFMARICRPTLSRAALAAC